MAPVLAQSPAGGANVDHKAGCPRMCSWCPLLQAPRAPALCPDRPGQGAPLIQRKAPWGRAAAMLHRKARASPKTSPASAQGRRTRRRSFTLCAPSPAPMLCCSRAGGGQRNSDNSPVRSGSLAPSTDGNTTAQRGGVDPQVVRG